MGRSARSIGMTVGLVLCGAMLAAGPAIAEHGKHKDHAKHLEEFDEKLNLTDAQRAQVEQIVNDYRQQMQPLHDQLKALNEEKHAKIKAVLTPEQQATFDEMGKEMQDEHHGHHHGHDH